MDYCSICKSRHTWDCEDERETGRTRCDNFEMDFSALDEDTKIMLEKIAIAHLFIKEKEA